MYFSSSGSSTDSIFATLFLLADISSNLSKTPFPPTPLCGFQKGSELVDCGTGTLVVAGNPKLNKSPELVDTGILVTVRFREAVTDPCGF